MNYEQKAILIDNSLTILSYIFTITGILMLLFIIYGILLKHGII